MNIFEKPTITIELFSFEEVVTTSGEPQRKSAYLAAMGNLESKDIEEAATAVFGFENDPNRN